MQTTFDSSIQKQVSLLSNAEKAVLVIIAAVPSANPTRELLLIQEHLMVRHSKLFLAAKGAYLDQADEEDNCPNEYLQSVPLTELGGRWAVQANMQLLHIYKRSFDPYSLQFDEEIYEEVAFKRYLRQQGHESKSDLDEKLMKYLGLNPEVVEALIEWASCFQEMLTDQKNAATSDRFIKKLSANSEHKDNKNISNSSKKATGPEKRIQTTDRLRSNPNGDQGSRYEDPPHFLAKTLTEVSYPLSFKEVSIQLLKMLAINELPTGTVSKLDFFAEEHSLKNCRFSLVEGKNSSILKFRSPAHNQSECQIMFDKSGNITNIYGIGEELEVGMSEW